LWVIKKATLWQIQKTTVYILGIAMIYIYLKHVAIYKKWVYYSGVKTFNNLPSDNTNTSGNLKKFKRSANNFHLPINNVIKYQKRAHYAGIKICNHLPNHIKCAVNEIQVFKLALKRFLLCNSFYSIQEYFNSNK